MIAFLKSDSISSVIHTRVALDPIDLLSQLSGSRKAHPLWPSISDRWNR
jgi:hypothetical protein